MKVQYKLEGEGKIQFWSLGSKVSILLTPCISETQYLSEMTSTLSNLDFLKVRMKFIFCLDDSSHVHSTLEFISFLTDVTYSC